MSETKTENRSVLYGCHCDVCVRSLDCEKIYYLHLLSEQWALHWLAEATVCIVLSAKTCRLWLEQSHMPKTQLKIYQNNEQNKSLKWEIVNCSLIYDFCSAIYLLWQCLQLLPQLHFTKLTKYTESFVQCEIEFSRNVFPFVIFHSI